VLKNDYSVIADFEIGVTLRVKEVVTVVLLFALVFCQVQIGSGFSRRRFLKRSVLL